jgi:DNA-binding PadR family transcriptional regulator
MGERQLTTTSYAILGQLALRSWTTYELVAEMRRNLRYFWPRAETLIYAEVKRLAAAGLATATTSYTGRRRRTTYAITPAGRAALAAWLETAPQRLLLEFEGLLRVLLAPFGTSEHLIASLHNVRDDADELLRMAEAIRGEYLAGRAPFQEHAAVRAFVYDFLVHHARMVRAWAERAIIVVEAWPELTAEERTRRALAIFAAGEANEAGVAIATEVTSPRSSAATGASRSEI